MERPPEIKITSAVRARSCGHRAPLIASRRSKFRWEQENGLGRDFTAVREEAARRKAAKEEEARLASERLEQEDTMGLDA